MQVKFIVVSFVEFPNYCYFGLFKHFKISIQRTTSHSYLKEYIAFINKYTNNWRFFGKSVDFYKNAVSHMFYYKQTN